MSMKNIKLFILPILTLSVAFLFQTVLFPSHASAISYNYTNYPMNDSTFTASFTMSASAIQTFLQNEGSGLATFSDIENCGPTTGANYTFYTQYYHCGSSESAAQIIYDVSQAYQINPQVILATMQKEQSLITTPNPISSQLDYAMGYGCADSSNSCSVSGFFNQVDNGTWQFRADIDLMNGISYWGYSPSSYPCNGATSYYSAPLKPGNNVTFYDSYGNAYTTFVIPNSATAALYCYTPHVFPGSSAQYYSGSYWFVYYFSIWFGSSPTPYAFMSSSSSTVYLFVDGYKVSVPNMAMLQDYGISPSSIQVLSQTAVNNIPTPSVASDNISPTLSYLIQTTSQPTIYLVTLGNKYIITSQQQFNDFGFNSANIAYLPLDFIASINGSQDLTNYIQNIHNSVFQVSNGVKRIIFNYQTYSSLNPSGLYTPVSDYIANSIASGLPISNSNILILNNEGAVFLFSNNQYYGIPSMNVYNCWGFTTTLSMPLYGLVYNSDVAPIKTASNISSCLANNNQGTTYLLNNTDKYPVPSSYGQFPETFNPDQNIIDILAQIPNAPQPLSQAVMSSSYPVVWYLENGVKKAIPSLSTLSLLNTGSITTLTNDALSSIQSLGIKLVDGQLVKSDTSGAVYIISGNSRVLFASADDFLAYHFLWSNIITLPQSNLDQSYPYNNVNIQKYIYDYSNKIVYLADKNGCYALSAGLLSNYGLTINNIASHQQYTGSVFSNLNLASCRFGSNNALDPNTGAIYYINNGIKYPYSSWSALVSQTGTTNPYIVDLSGSTLSTLPTGTAIN